MLGSSIGVWLKYEVVFDSFISMFCVIGYPRCVKCCAYMLFLGDFDVLCDWLSKVCEVLCVLFELIDIDVRENSGVQ